MNTFCVAIALLSTGVSAWEDTCDTFGSIYSDGKDMCETIFGDAFIYTADEELAYTMWWFDYVNSNDAVSTTLFGDAAVSNCTVQSMHKSGKPTPEPNSFTECHPWQDSSCCHEENVASAEHLKTMYGSGWQWDRCGPMSQACERFFVQEACLYECDVNIGNYKRYTNTSHNDHNDWEIFGMPIKASYCDSWYTACYEDYFCGGESGNFFECEAYYWDNLAAEEATDDDEDIIGMGNPFPVIGSIFIAAAAFLFLVILIVLVLKERTGKPMFAPINFEEVSRKESEMT